MKLELQREAPVNTQGNLNVDRVGSQWIPIAPVDEQKLVVRQIEAITVGLNTAIRRFEREGDLLREFRIRLIADVVTGKVNVRDAVAGLPDVDPLAGEDDPDGGFDREAGSEGTGWRPALEAGSPLADVS